jgi:hypothetical protein
MVRENSRQGRITNQVTLGDLLAKQINVLPTIANSLPYGGTY